MQHVLNHCRFCGKAEWGTWGHSKHLLKYGTRHYAHHDCFLKAGKDVGKLRGYAIRKFPKEVLRKHGQLDRVERLIRMMDVLGNG
jgi:hypothetical protein